MNHAKKLTVRERLELETLRRGANGAFAQISLLVAMLFLTPPFPHIHWYRLGCCLLILLIFMRWLVFRKLHKNPERLSNTNPWNINAGLSTALFWAFLNSLVIVEFKVNSLTGLMHIFITNGLMAAVMYSLSPTPKIQRAYILILGLSVSVTVFIVERNSTYQYAAAALLIFVFYLFLASKNHSHDLRSAYEFENSLMIQNMKLQEVIDSIPGFMLIISGRGELLQHSKTSRIVFDSSELKEEIRNFQKSDTERRTKELNLANDTEHFYVVTFEKLKSAEGHVIVTGLPIDELKQMRSELEFASRLAAIGEMAGGVAHEINNPLAVISLSTEFLKSKLEKNNVDSSLWQKHMDKIVETTGRISRIIKSLQNLTREDVLDASTRVDLDVIIKETLDICLENMKRKGIHLNYESIGSVMVKGKHLDIGQVLLNLINNSFDAIEGEGIIDIKVKYQNSDVQVSVSDNGPGIPDHLIEKLFNPFFSTKPVGEGSGLGLPISRSLLMKYGGDLELSRSKDPTTFQITLKKA